jgi:hypothetical protein
VTENLGYAVAAQSLQPLLDKPNPIPMARWLTIGVLNRKYWQAADDAVRWTAGRPHRVEGRAPSSWPLALPVDARVPGRSKSP